MAPRLTPPHCPPSNPRALANRTALGIVGDYKPWVAQLGNGDLLIIAFAPSPGHSGGSVSAHLLPPRRTLVTRAGC